MRRRPLHHSQDPTEPHESMRILKRHFEHHAKHNPVHLTFMFICSYISPLWVSLVAQLAKNPPAVRGTWVGKTPGEGIGYPLQYSGLESSRDCVVHGVTKSLTGLSGFHSHFRPPWSRKQYDHPSSTDEETEACRVRTVSKITQWAVTGKKGFQPLSVF